MSFSRTYALVPVDFALCKIQIACGIFSEVSQENNSYFKGKVVPQSLTLQLPKKLSSKNQQ